jgi:hypothetical protein
MKKFLMAFSLLWMLASLSYAFERTSDPGRCGQGPVSPEYLELLQKLAGQSCVANQGCPKDLVCLLPADSCRPDAVGTCVIPLCLTGFLCAPPMEGHEVCVCDEGQIKQAHDACHARMFGQTVIRDEFCRSEPPGGSKA